jgi:YkoP-like protein
LRRAIVLVPPWPEFGYIATVSGNFFGGWKVARDWGKRGDPLMAVWDSAGPRTRAPYSHPWLADVLFALDGRLQRRQAVFEYTGNPFCIFRVDIAHSRERLVLRDGTRVHRGERIARLHFWNEHIPQVPQDGATIAWARQMQHAIAISLHELACYLGSHSDLADIAVICADVPSGTRTQSDQLARIMARFGFEAIVHPDRLPVGERLHLLGENVLISLIVFAQNASTLRRDTLKRVRLPIYLSRRTLDERFGHSSDAALGAAAAS